MGETTAEYRCLSVRQPWAALIAGGTKRVENRSWPTDYRGTFALHAARSRVNLAGWDEARVAELAFGAVIALVELRDCVRYADLPADLRGHEYAVDEPGNWCWVLGSVRLLPTPVMCKGQTRWFTVTLPAGKRVAPPEFADVSDASEKRFRPHASAKRR